jgi:DNA-directed RNA polymerase specialized sigma24 family protein
MLIVGFLYDGANKNVIASALILLGAGELAVGALLPRLSELEIGPSGFRTKLSAEDGAFRPVFSAEGPRLERFAKLMCADTELAQQLVEEALAKARERQRQIPRSDRPAAALRALVELLETAEERRWIQGRRRKTRTLGAGNDTDAEILHALAALDYPVRAAFVLRVDWPLGTDEVAAILRRPVDVVRTDIERARGLLRPHVEMDL